MTTKKRKDKFSQGMGPYSTFINQLYQAVFTNAVAWGIDPLAVAAILALLTPFNAAYAVSKEKTTATSVDRQKTKDARKALNKIARPFVQKWIFLNDTMTDADIKTCGLEPKDRIKTPVGRPDTSPDMYLKPSTSHTIKGTFRQPKGEDGSEKIGKPDGVKSIRVAVFVGATPPASPDDFQKFYSFTRTSGSIPFPAAQAGQAVTISSCWVNEKEEQGDWCEPQDTNVP